MRLRRYQPSDRHTLVRLFYETIQHINRRDYTQDQLDAWSAGCFALTNAFFRARYTLVAVEGGRIVGYGNITTSGYLDHLFVHKDFQRQGVAATLCQALEAYAWTQGLSAITVHASITALGFFLHRGYQVQTRQFVSVRGRQLMNFILFKHLRAPGIEQT